MTADPAAVALVESVALKAGEFESLGGASGLPPPARRSRSVVVVLVLVEDVDEQVLWCWWGLVVCELWVLLVLLMLLVLF